MHQRVKICTHDSECSSVSCKYLSSWQNSTAIEYHVASTWTSRPPDTSRVGGRATAWPPGLERLSLLCRTLIKQDSGANIFPAEKRSQIHRCCLARAAVGAQQILHVQVLRSVSACTQDGGKVCGTSGSKRRPSVPGCSLAQGGKRCTSPLFSAPFVFIVRTPPGGRGSKLF